MGRKEIPITFQDGERTDAQAFDYDFVAHWKKLLLTYYI
jgi:hypothetical protein